MVARDETRAARDLERRQPRTAPAREAAMSHDHGPVPAASRHTRRIVTAVLAPAALATLVALILLWPGSVRAEPDPAGPQRALGTVTSVTEQACPAGSAQQRCGSATVRITEGTGTGSTQV